MYIFRQCVVVVVSPISITKLILSSITNQVRSFRRCIPLLSRSKVDSLSQQVFSKKFFSQLLLCCKPKKVRVTCKFAKFLSFKGYGKCFRFEFISMGY